MRKTPVGAHGRGTGAGALVPQSRGTVARGPPARYGALVDSNEVHEEIRDLASRAKGVIEKHFQKHATSEEQVLQGIRRFGPSAQSKAILNRENSAAVLAMQTGVYAVWRCDEPKLRGSNTDFCARLGYEHRCFCGHTLKEHAAPKPSRGRVPPPRCECCGCGCGGFSYVPNEPEEIGEGWLTRRAAWDPAKWSPKCRCGHGSRQHDPKSRACGQCGCGAFASHFLCVACDRDGEAHATVFELEEGRAGRGLPVREAYLPLAGLEWGLRELVFEDPSAGGALTAPPAEGSGGTARPRLKGPPPAPAGPAGPSALSALSAEVPQHCAACATVFRSAESKFCTKCGKPRGC